MIVCKFGGTSVGDAEAIARTAAIIGARRERKPVVVVSALAGATNALLAIAEQAARGQLIGALAAIPIAGAIQVIVRDLIRERSERKQAERTAVATITPEATL